MHYYFSDHLGSHAAIQSGDGSTCEHDVDYYPYGGVEQDYCAGPLQNYKFTGKERDNESGLDNFKARYYASSLARMQSPDPLGITAATLTNPQSLNLYAYALDNPLRYVDPTGKQAVALNNGFLQGSTKLKCTYQGDVCQDQAGDPKQEKNKPAISLKVEGGAGYEGHIKLGKVEAKAGAAVKGEIEVSPNGTKVSANAEVGASAGPFKLPGVKAEIVTKNEKGESEPPTVSVTKPGVDQKGSGMSTEGEITVGVSAYAGWGAGVSVSIRPHELASDIEDQVINSLPDKSGIATFTYGGLEWDSPDMGMPH